MRGGYISISLDIHWVGYRSESELPVNSYLVVNYAEAVLINPGPLRTIEYILQKIEKALAESTYCAKLKAVLVGAETSDFSSGLIKIHERYPNINIYCAEGVAKAFKGSGFDASLKCLDKDKNDFCFTNGRKIEGIELQYMPTRNSLAFYDTASRVLFSGYYGSSLVENDSIIASFSEENHSDFLEPYSQVWALNMDTFKSFRDKNISIIAPHYGPIILDGAEHILLLTPEKKEVSGENCKANSSTNTCPITKLFNGFCFLNKLENYIEEYRKTERNAAILIIDIDNLAQINHLYGNDTGNETIRNMAYAIKEKMVEGQELFKLSGPAFACFLPGQTRSEAQPIAETLRYEISQSTKFVQPVTVSIGLVSFDEFKLENTGSPDIAKLLLKLARNRVAIAKHQGMNSVCYSSSIYEDIKNKPKILIIENDISSYAVLSQMLKKLGWDVYWGKDGDEALRIIEIQRPQVIVSELMVPKIGGFEIRERLLQFTELKKIPFIVVSHRKNDETILRAFNLEIDYYFKKPYNIIELIGLLTNKIKQVNSVNA